MKKELIAGNIVEVNSFPNVAYVLNEPGLFSATGYKFLKTQEAYFIPCKTLLYNGKKKFVYFTREYKSLEQILTSIALKDMFALMAMLVKAMIEIRNNGFLSCNNIPLSTGKIFFDTNPVSIKFIYLPIGGANGTTKGFESDLKHFVVNIITNQSPPGTKKNVSIEKEILSPELTLEELYQKLYSEYKAPDKPVNHDTVVLQQAETVQEKCMELIHTQDETIIKIIKDDFVIGKSVHADGVITGNKAVSRRHCKIVKKRDGYAVVDLESANGTYLNGVRIRVNEEYALQDEDKLRLANSDWIVKL